MNWIPAILAVFVALPAVSKVPPAVERALTELKTCRNVDAPVCRALPTRLSNYGHRAVRPLMKTFEELSPAGQILGMIALASINHAKSTTALIYLSRKSGYLVRTMALTALGNRSGRQVDKALVRAMKDPHPAIRAAAAEAIGNHEGARNRRIVFSPLLSAADDDELAVRIAAVESLGMLGEKKALAVVLRALASRHIALRRTALFALGFLDDKRSVSKVIEVLRDDDPVLVDSAGKTLRKLTGVDFGNDYELWKGWWMEREDEVAPGP